MISAKLIVKAFTLLAFIIAHNANNVKSESKHEYAVIIDAACTSSRILAYHFIVTDDTVKLASPEHYSRKTPGLPEYLYTPHKGVEQITKLIDNAKHYFVPDGYWANTILSVRLPGGLQNPPKNEVVTLMEKLGTAVGEIGFESNVDFLNGLDEARFSWFTVNFLTDLLNTDMNNTRAVIDLGGGSLKVAYIPINLNLNITNIQKYVIMGQTKQMYCNCFPDLGLMSGRKSTFIFPKDDPVNATSNCIHQNVQNISFKFNHESFIVSGAATDNGSIDYESCKKSIEYHVTTNITDNMEDLQKQKVVAISYFFEITKDARLVDVQGREIAVHKLYTAAKHECNKVYRDTTCPYTCLDYTYNAVLLDKGFGLSSVTVVNRINDHEISWSLGAAFELLQNKIIKDDHHISKIQHEYAVVIDAGITSSSVLGFHFISTDDSVTAASPDYYYKITPGLSGYLNIPDQGTESIITLAKMAKYCFVPKDYWPKTKLIMRLSEGQTGDKFNNILDKIRTAVDKIGFKNSVGSLNESAKACLSWFTVNFLTNRLNIEVNNTTAVMYLGSYSLEVAFIPTNQDLTQENIMQRFIMGKTKKMYNNCFSDLGLMSGRKNTFNQVKSDPANVTSKCIHEKVKNLEFHFDETIFNVSGAATTDGFIDYQSCKSSIETYVSSKLPNKLEDLKNIEVVAISYFFDRAKDAELVDDNGGNITVERLYLAAENECNNKFWDNTCPYKCLDYTYIAVLLDKGFCLTAVTVLGKVNGHKLNWSLASAINQIGKSIQTNKSISKN